MINLFSHIVKISSLKNNSRYFSSKSRLNGIVKFFDRNRGFGMITVENNPVDYFVHRKGIFGQDDENKEKHYLMNGEPVEFDLFKDSSKGRIYCTNVTGPNGKSIKCHWSPLSD